MKDGVSQHERESKLSRKEQGKGDMVDKIQSETIMHSVKVSHVSSEYNDAHVASC